MPPLPEIFLFVALAFSLYMDTKIAFFDADPSREKKKAIAVTMFILLTVYAVLKFYGVGAP